MDRRFFLKTTAATVGGLLLGDILGPQTAAAAVPYKQGIVNYALSWAREGQRQRNPAYPSFSNKDCTNFASQALIAAGLRQDSSWWCNRQWWSVGGWGYSPSWSVVGNFRSYHLEQKRTATLGGVYDISYMAHYQNLYDRAVPGDMLQVLTPSGEGHTMIITVKDRGLLRLTYHSAAGDLDRVNISLWAFHNLWTSQRLEQPAPHYYLLKF